MTKEFLVTFRDGHIEKYFGTSYSYVIYHHNFLCCCVYPQEDINNTIQHVFTADIVVRVDTRLIP